MNSWFLTLWLKIRGCIFASLCAEGSGVWSSRTEHQSYWLWPAERGFIPEISLYEPLGKFVHMKFLFAQFSDAVLKISHKFYNTKFGWLWRVNTKRMKCYIFDVLGLFLGITVALLILCLKWSEEWQLLEGSLNSIVWDTKGTHRYKNDPFTHN